MSALRAATIRADRLRLAVALVITLLLVWPVFARGLYSHSVQYWVFWNAVAPREAVQEVIKYGLYLMVLLSVSEIAHSGKVREGRAGAAAGQTRVGGPAGLARVIWGSVVLLGLASLLGAVDLLPFEAARDGRLFTLLGYPNSAGSLAGAALFLGLGLRPAPAARERPWLLAIHSDGQWVLATTLFLTMSRGAWLVAPVALAVTLALWTPGRRLTALGDLALTGLGAVLVAPFLGAASRRPASLVVTGRPSRGGKAFAAGTSVGRQAGRFVGSTVRPDQLSVFARASALDPLSPASRLNAGRAYGMVYQSTARAYHDEARPGFPRADEIRLELISLLGGP